MRSRDRNDKISRSVNKKKQYNQKVIGKQENWFMEFDIYILETEILLKVF